MKYISRGEGKRRVEFNGDTAPEGWTLIDEGNQSRVKPRATKKKVVKKR